MTDMMYSDFFAPPRGVDRGKARTNGIKQDKKKQVNGKGKQRVRFGDDLAENEDEDEESGEEDDEEAGRDVMGRFQGDLFDDDDDDEDDTKSEHPYLKYVLRAR